MRIVISILLVSLLNVSYGQIVKNRCSTTEHSIMMHNAFPQLKQLEEEYETRIFLEKKEKSKTEAIQHFVIPVAVHVVGDKAISEMSANGFQAVHDQIKILNEDYRKKSGTPGFGNGVDMGINFCLATIDDAGNSTSGIIQHPDPITPYPKWILNMTDPNLPNGDYSLKAIEHWDPQFFLNVYIVEMGDPNSLGWATFPTELWVKPEIDGIVMNYEYFGYNSTLHYNAGRTMTHEVGHWLNLRHIWGDGDCSVDDFVDDTPICTGTEFSDITNGCLSVKQCLTENLNVGILDNTRQIENYMDYSDDLCMNMFTLGQRSRARSALLNLRAGIAHNGIEQVSCSFPSHCNNGIQDEDELGIDCGGVDCIPCNFTSSGGDGGPGSCSHTLGDGFLLNGKNSSFVIVCDDDISFLKPDNECDMVFSSRFWSEDDDDCESPWPNASSDCYDDECWKNKVLVDISEVERNLWQVKQQNVGWIEPVDEPNCPYGIPYHRWNDISDYADGIGGVQLEAGKFYRFIIGSNYKRFNPTRTDWEENKEYFYILPAISEHDNEVLNGTIDQWTKSVSITNSTFEQSSSTMYVARDYIELNTTTLGEKGAFMDLSIAPGLECTSKPKSKNKVDEINSNIPLSNQVEPIISLFPNPTHGFVTVETNLSIKKIELVHLNGSMKHLILNDNKIELDDVPAGIYFTRFTTNENITFQKKLIVY